MNIETKYVKEMLEDVLKDHSMTDVCTKTGVSKVTLYNILKEVFDTTQFEVAKKIAVNFGYSPLTIRNSSHSSQEPRNCGISP